MRIIPITGIEVSIPSKQRKALKIVNRHRYSRAMADGLQYVVDSGAHIDRVALRIRWNGRPSWGLFLVRYNHG